MTEQDGKPGGERVSPVIPLVIACGMFMSQLDSTIIATSTPQMAQSLGVNPLMLNIAITSYLISMAVFIPISGWCADRFGPRRVFCGALVTFLLGSILCGLADSLAMLIVARVLQGLGGAMMTPVGRLILVRSFPKAQLVTAMNYVSMPALIGPILGPLVGGALTTYLSWRWIFYINLPIGAAGFLMARRFVPDLPVPPPPRFDFRGFVLAGACIAALTVFIESLGKRVASPPEQGALLLGAVLLAAVYVWHARRVPNPVIGTAVFRVPSFRIATTSGGVSRFGVGAVPFLLPLLFQIGYGLDPLHSGMLTFVTSIGAMVNKTVVRRLLRWLGLRSLLSINGCLLGLMICGLALLRASTPHPVIWSYLLLFGFVRSVQFTSVNALAYSHLTPELMSKATSAASVAQQLSMSLGVAIGAMLLSLEVGGSGTLVAADFPPVFVLIGILPAVASLGFLRLAPDTGADVTGHTSRRVRPA